MSATDGSDDLSLKGERMGTSFVVVKKTWTDILLELAAPVACKCTIGHAAACFEPEQRLLDYSSRCKE